jgi:hypothetical protein
MPACGTNVAVSDDDGSFSETASNSDMDVDPAMNRNQSLTITDH